jgi:hypothetical protein
MCAGMLNVRDMLFQEETSQIMLTSMGMLRYHKKYLYNMSIFSLKLKSKCFVANVS